MRILLSAQDAASQVIRGAGSALGGAGLAGVAVEAAAAVAVLGVALGVEAVRAAGDFQQAMLSLVAHAGLAKSQVDNVSQAILNMAPIVGRSPTELADAMYPILSAFSGITNQSAKSALALSTLKLSFEAVAGTTTNGTDVAQAAVGTFNALGLATNNAATNAKRMADLMDIMDLTVQQGNMRWETYKNVISKLAVSIQGTGIKFTEASSALATLTNEGYSAQRAQTYLSNMFTAMAIKTDALAKHAKSLKIAFDEQKYSSMSLADKIGYLNQITDGNKQKLLALLGGNATALKSFNALSIGLSSYKSNLQALQHAHGALATSFATASQGFNFSMQRMRAAVDVVLVTIGSQLLPILTPIINKVAVLIGQFAQWLVKSGALKNAIQLVVGVISTLVTIGSSVVGFFTKNQWAADLLIAVLAGVAAGVLAFVATAIPALVAGFIAWAVAAGAAAVATLAATWPFILIGAVIAAVVFGIIMAVQHWGQIVAWLRGVWSAFSSWIGDIFSAIGTTVHNALLGIANFFVQKWDELQSFVKSIPQKIQQALATLAGILLAPFKWFYDHNIYVKAAVDFIHSKLTELKNFVGSIFSAIGTFIHDRLTWTKNFVGSIFSAIGTFVHDKIMQLAVFLYNKWEEIKTAVFSKVTALKNLVGDAFSALGSTIHQKLTDAWNWIVSFVSGWPAQAAQWGVNLIKGLIGGITSMVGNLMSTIGGIAHNIAGFLGFHSPPKLGPLHDADTYMPNMLQMFTSGLRAGKPALQGALSDLALPISATFHGTPAAGGTGAGYGAPASGGHIFYITIDTMAGSRAEVERLADLLEQEIARRFRGQTPGYASGSIFA